MGQFYRFLQGVVVAKDKSGAYVPKKYIVRRHGSGFPVGSSCLSGSRARQGFGLLKKHRKILAKIRGNTSW